MKIVLATGLDVGKAEALTKQKYRYQLLSYHYVKDTPKDELEAYVKTGKVLSRTRQVTQLPEGEPQEVEAPIECYELGNQQTNDQETNEEPKLFEREEQELEKIASRIEQEMISVKKKIYIIGKLLHRAKEMLSHGQFTKWVEKRFKGDLPYSTAWLYAAIYDKLEYHHELIEAYPLHILMDVRKLPIEILKLIKERPDDFKENRSEVMEIYRSFKRREIELPEFIERYKEITVIEDFLIPDEQAESRIERTRVIYKKHLVEQLKNQLGTVLKTVQELEKILNEDEQTEIRDSLSSEIDLTIMGTVRIKELLSKNESFVNVLSQYRTLPSSPEPRTINKRVPMCLPRSKL